MKRYLLGILWAGSHIAAMQALPGLSIFWKTRISLPLLNLVTQIGSCVDFVILEWIVPALGLGLLIALLRGGFLRLIRRTVSVLLLVYLLIWYPLYFPLQSAPQATDVQLTSLCLNLIEELNGDSGAFTVPEDLPGKQACFSGWMDALNIDGFCSFFTGEAIYSPNVPDCALPFLAVHEDMHLRGIAGEGAANIAAWQKCMQRGGAYAHSAKLWALRYSMGILQERNRNLYTLCMERMHPDTMLQWQSCGGGRRSGQSSALLKTAAFPLGTDDALWDYEILASWLAAGFGQ